MKSDIHPAERSRRARCIVEGTWDGRVALMRVQVMFASEWYEGLIFENKELTFEREGVMFGREEMTFEHEG